MANRGWWVHFISPARNGAQPFDVVAVKDGRALAIDCKTSIKRKFSIDRLEDNQKMAFEKWLRCGNEEPLVAVKYNDTVYLIQYSALKDKGVVDLEKEVPF